MKKTEKTPMRMAILGSGSVGGYFGGRLAAAESEVVAVGRAKGVPLAVDFAENRLAFCDTLPANMTSSMQADLERGNRPEVPWLSGNVIEVGRAFGAPTPVNRVISDALALCVQGGR